MHCHISCRQVECAKQMGLDMVAIVAGAQAPHTEAGEMAVLPSQQRRSCESRVRRRLAECCAAGSEVGGMSCTDAVRRAGSAEPASIDPRAVEATSKPIMKRRSLAAHRNCCGAPRACGEVRGSSGNRSSGRCARSITEAERSAGAAAVDGSTVIRRKSMAQDSAGLRSSPFFSEGILFYSLVHSM